MSRLSRRLERIAALSAATLHSVESLDGAVAKLVSILGEMALQSEASAPPPSRPSNRTV